MGAKKSGTSLQYMTTASVMRRTVSTYARNSFRTSIRAEGLDRLKNYSHTAPQPILLTQQSLPLRDLVSIKMKFQPGLTVLRGGVCFFTVRHVFHCSLR